LAAPANRQYARSRCAQAASTPRSAASGAALEVCPLATSANSPISTYGTALRETTSPKRAAAACATLMCGASITSSRAPLERRCQRFRRILRGRHHLQRQPRFVRRFLQPHHARRGHQRRAQHHDARRLVRLGVRAERQRHQQEPGEEARHFPPCTAEAAGTASAGT
jgi:hypothetical protein